MWMQPYDPLGNWPLSTAAAALPILVLLGLLASGRVDAGRSALAGLADGLRGGLLRLRDAGADDRWPARRWASVFAVFRIVWLIVAAVFLYDIAVATGQFEVMKASVARLSADRRLQAVLVAFSFGAFIEGAAGFGAPVAISAAFLVGLGFQPFQAALLCLIANTAPVAWGGIGTPMRTLSAVTGLDVEALSATSGRILPLLSVLIPFWLVRTMTGWRETLAVWIPLAGHRRDLRRRPVPLVELRGVRARRHRRVGREHGGRGPDPPRLEAQRDLAVRPRGRGRRSSRHRPIRPTAGDHPATGHSPDSRQVARAWMPFALLTVTVLVWGIPAIKPWGTPAVKDWLDARLSWKPEIAWLHLKVAKGEAVTGHERPSPGGPREGPARRRPALLDGDGRLPGRRPQRRCSWASRPTTQARLLAGTVRRMIPAIFAILCMLALGFVTKYSGMDAVLGLAFTRTGRGLYPIFGTLLGWLGRGTDGLGHLEQRPLRQPPEDHRAQARARSRS